MRIHEFNRRGILILFPLNKDKFSKAMVASFLLALTLFFSGPLSIYFSNNIELPYTIAEIWPYLLGLSLCITAVLTLVMMLLKESAYKKVISMVFMLGLLFWIQGNLLLWNYGLLDGNKIDWNKYVANGIIDTSIWLLLLVVALLKNELMIRFIKTGSLFFILLQIISLSYNWINAPEEPQFKQYSYNEESQFTFSSNKNVVILLLDTFQTDVFQEIINEDSTYKSELSGFTYFRNSVGGFPTTYPSVPLIMTGQYYDNSEPIQQFLKEKYQSQSLPLVLKRNGFNVGLYPMVEQTIYPTTEIASNIVRKGAVSFAIPKTVLNLYQLTFFKYSPHFLKPYFHKTEVLDQESKSRDLEFLKRAETETKVGEKTDVFKFYHLLGPHPPFNMNEKLEKVDLSNDREGYKTKAKGSMEITRRFLQSLKKSGVYDKSYIYIVGDHGLGQDVNRAAALKGDGEDPVLFDPKVAAGIPLILYKALGSNGELKTSDAPVSLSDIPATVVTNLDIKDNFPGRSMDDINENEKRERRFYYYSWGHEYWSKEYLPSMKEYTVQGFSWNSTSWFPTYRSFDKGSVHTISPVVYKYGSDISFGIQGNNSQFEMSGFSAPEDGFTWTNGQAVSFIIPVSPPNSDVILRVVGMPFISDMRPQQRINVIVNGKRLAEWKATGDGEFTVIIPKETVTGEQIKIVLELPDAISPLDAKINGDVRKLAIAVRSIKISELK
jgi:hypothetical protein